MMLRPAEICDLARNGLEAGFSQLTSDKAIAARQSIIAAVPRCLSMPVTADDVDFRPRIVRLVDWLDTRHGEKGPPG